MRKRFFPFFLSIGFPLAAVYLFCAQFFLIAHVKEESMEPTLRDGQTILLMKKITSVHGRNGTGIKKGDIVVFPSPDEKCLVVKRCVLTEGDSIQIEHGWLITENGRYFLSESQWDFLKAYDSVPAGKFFAVGDNQFYSIDSRDYGFIDRDKAIGKVILMNKGL